MLNDNKNNNDWKLIFLKFQLDINTVAAGGGSRLFFRCGRYDVGPESARAHPGPVCYRKSKNVMFMLVLTLVVKAVIVQLGLPNNP